MGRPWRQLSARHFYRHKEALWEAVTDSLDGLLREHDLVVIEGAGSPVELNLKAGDIANMRVALHADAPVLLVGDVDRGGIFAQILGRSGCWKTPSAR
jgi:adenosylcobyric acid synthase